MNKRALYGLLATAVVIAIAACGGGKVEPTATQQATANPSPAASVAPATAVAAASPQATPEYVVSVYFTNTGPEPADVFVPRGQRVRLVLRNRDYYEHHYRVVGLVPENLAWILQPDAPLSDKDINSLDATAAAGGATSADEDSHHHGGGVVYFRDPSEQGIQPLGDEVHGYAEPGGIDTVLFTPTNLGTFQVEDPLYPAFTGTMTVFQPANP